MLVTRWTLKRPLLVGFLVSVCLHVLLPSCESQTPPRNINDCKLNASSPFSFVVQVWDSWKKNEKDRSPTTTGRSKSHFNFGALITRKAVLSTAWSYRAAMNSKDWISSGAYDRYKVTGQNIWDYTNKLFGLEHPCFQSRKVTDIQLYPKARGRGSRLHYDFSVIFIITHFSMTSSIFPTIFFPYNPLDLLLDVRYVNVEGNRVTCALPVPDKTSLEGKKWTFNDRNDVSSIPFRSKCINHICEPSEDAWKKWGSTLGEEYKTGCIRKYKNVVNGTMLCMVPRWNRYILMDAPTVPTSYAGIPLVCNGSTLGITSQVKDGYSRHTKAHQDFFLVITLLRIHPWLTGKIREQGPPTNDAYNGDGKKWGYQEYQEPVRASTPDWGHDDFLHPLNYKTLLPVHLKERSGQKGLAPAAIYSSPCFWKTLMTSHVFHLMCLIHFQ